MFNVVGIALGLLAVRIVFAPLYYFYIICPTIGNCGLDYFKNMAKPIALSIVMGVIVSLLNGLIKATPINLIGVICAGILIYVMLLYVFDRQVLLKVKEHVH